MDLPNPSSRAKRGDHRDMQVMLLFIYPLCLAAAILSRLTPRDRADAAPRRSVFAEASASASACIPFVFR